MGRAGARERRRVLFGRSSSIDQAAPAFPHSATSTWAGTDRSQDPAGGRSRDYTYPGSRACEVRAHENRDCASRSRSSWCLGSLCAPKHADRSRDSSAGRASEGPRFDPGSRHVFMARAPFEEATLRPCAFVTHPGCRASEGAADKKVRPAASGRPTKNGQLEARRPSPGV